MTHAERAALVELARKREDGQFTDANKGDKPLRAILHQKGTL
jgi:hypothetical protein